MAGRSSAWSWLALGAGALILLWLASKLWKSGTEPDRGSQGSSAGGLGGWLADLLGGRARSDVALEEGAQQDFAGQDSGDEGEGSAAVTGHFLIRSGDSINRELFAGTVRVPFALVNSSRSSQRVLVQLAVYWDFLISDEATTWEELIDVDGQSGKHVEADLAVPAVVLLRNPRLYVDLTIAGVHQDRIEDVEVY